MTIAQAPTTSGLGRAVPVARRLTLRSRSRFAIATGVCSIVVMLVVVELAVLTGLEQTSSWVLDTGGDLFIVEAGSEPYSAGIHYVPDEARVRAETIEGVEKVIVFDIASADMEIPGYEGTENSILTAWDPGDLDLDVIRGSAPSELGDLVVDDGFARARGLEVGSKITLVGGDAETTPARIVGMTGGASLLIVQNVFSTPATLADLQPASDSDREAAETATTDLEEMVTELELGAERLRDAAESVGIFGGAKSNLNAGADSLDAIAEEAAEGSASVDELRQRFDPVPPAHLAIKVADDADPAKVEARLARLDGVDVYRPEAFRAGVESASVGPFRPVLLFVVALAVIVGTLVLGMTLSTMVSESIVDYAVLRSLGRSRAALRRTILGQGGYLIGTALVLGMALGTLAVVAVSRLMPLLPAALTPRIYVLATIMSIAMLVLGSLLPMRRVLRVEPVEVFRA